MKAKIYRAAKDIRPDQGNTGQFYGKGSWLVREITVEADAQILIVVNHFFEE
ncbi:MAG: hypothetical protein BroJett011_27490 [Chloroflexota bacterium]|nr:MAG: hypothetical protein BroJett011_27490 [Chloroflexota bacterium]